MKGLRLILVLLLAAVLLGLWALLATRQGAFQAEGKSVAPAEAHPIIRAEGKHVFLAQMLHRAPVNPLYLGQAWTANAQGDPSVSFLVNETVFYRASGMNAATQPVETSLTWSLEGPCSPGTLTTETRSLSPGDWTAVYSQTAPVCAGVYTYTITTETLSRTHTASAVFNIASSVGVVIWNRAAFDKCDIPSLAQLSVWWPHSPYWSVNVYIGGIHRACPNLNLNPQWVSSAMAQGWGLIPTWVGPQAPCSRYTHRISYNLAEAYAQGRAEADAASLAAANLGMTASGTGRTILYYDMEGYSWRDETGCRAAVKSFVSGWVERLHELGSLAGVYGGSCSSYVTDWASLPHPPDQVWIAAWYTDGYDPSAGVFNVSCVSPTLWANHQRLRQYAGDLSETWGGLRMNIDCNVTDGAVLAEVGSGQTAHTLIEALASPQVSSFGLLAGGQAWALQEGDLLWLDASDRAWAATSAAPGVAQQAFFLDERQGWLLTGTGLFAVSRSLDSGQTWQTSPLGGEELLGSRPVSISFIDAQNGWAVFRLPSSANFSTAALYRTQDGGVTWQALPEPPGAQVTFVSAQDGWALSGPLPDHLYRTQDGGLSWTEQVVLSARAPGQVFYALPVFSDVHNGVIAVTIWEGGAARLEILASHDGGSTWQPQGRLSLAAAEGLDGPLTAALLDEQHAWVADPSGGIYITADGGRTWQFSHNLPLGVLELTFITPQQGWVLASAGDCKAAGQACTQESALWQTLDGGLTWSLTIAP